MFLVFMLRNGQLSNYNIFPYSHNNNYDFLFFFLAQRCFINNHVFNRVWYLYQDIEMRIKSLFSSARLRVISFVSLLTNSTREFL